MARTRLIKPSFFLDEAVAELPDTAQLLFIGLWTIADRNGRLRDAYKSIRAQIFPYREVNVSDLLDLIASANLIDRYKVGNERIIQIRSFAKHQHCHVNEPKGTLPEKPKVKRARKKYGASTVLVPESSGTSTVQAPEDSGASTVQKRQREHASSFNIETDTEREPHARARGSKADPGSLSFSPQLESIIEEILASGLYELAVIRKVAKKQSVYLEREPTKRELLGWLNSEKGETHGDPTTRTNAKIDKVVQDLVRDRDLNKAQGGSS
jgi:hypothetical protein